MADNDRSGKDFNPKHRVIGAIVLVSLAVIFVPMILDERTPPPSPAVAQLSDIPSPETKILVADITPTTETLSVPTAPPTTTPTKVPATVDTSAVTPAVATAPKEAMTHEAAVKPALQSTMHSEGRDSVSKGWFVQVGTFSNSENASQLANRLRAHGFPVNLEKVVLADGKAVRVRVGPYRGSAQAKQAQTDLKRKAGVSGLLHAD